MTRDRVHVSTPLVVAAAVLAVTLTGLVAGGSPRTTGDGPGSATGAVPVASAPSAGATRAPTYGGRVRVDGAVRRPIFLGVRDLERRYEQRTVTTTFTAAGRPTTRVFTGPLLLDVLTDARPRFDTEQSNDQLAFAVRVGATDGYRAVLAWGEIDPGFAGTEVLLATTEDGRPLTRPRLVVPGDVRGGRYVTDVLDVRVLDLG